MNWYRQNKSAGITFFPVGSEKISQPMYLLDICHDLTNYGYYRSDILKGTGVKLDDIEPDGDSEFTGPTGIINVYMPIYRFVRDEGGGVVKQAIPEIDQMTPEKAQKLINGYNEDMAGEVVLQLIRVDTSNLKGIPVARVQVVENNTEDREEIPEISLSNDNAAQFLKLLAQHGLPINPEEYGGVFSVEDYFAARQFMTTEAIQSHERDSYDSGEESGGPRMIDSGLSSEQLNMYLRVLDDIAAWIQRSGMPDQEIAYS